METEHRHRRHRAIRLAMFTSFLSKGGTLLLHFIAVPVAYNTLGPERFALFGLAQTILWILSLTDFGIGPSVTRRIAAAVGRGDQEEVSRVAATGFFASTLFVLVAVGLLGALLATTPVTTLFGEKFAPYAAELRACLWLALALFGLMGIASALERNREGYQEVHIGNAFGAAGNVLSAAVLFGGIAHFRSVTFVLLAMYGIQLLAMSADAAQLLWKRPWLRPAARLIRGPTIKSMLAEGLGVAVAMNFPFVQREGIKWLLGRSAGPQAVADFMVLIQLGFFLTGFVLMFTRPLWPAVADAAARKDWAWLRALRRKTMLGFAAFAALTTLGMLLLGPWFVDLWLQRDVALDWRSCGLFAVGFCLTMWTHLHYILLAGCGQVRRVAWIIAAETCIVLPLAWLLGKNGGMNGMLLASIAAQTMLAAWALPWLLKRQLFHR